MNETNLQFKIEERGFTLVEVLLVMGVFGVLASLITINLLRPQTKSLVDTTLITLVSDIKAQQIKSMIGETGGIYFETDHYTLFKGSNYSPSEPTNFGVELKDNVILTDINFPSNQIIFNRVSGEVSNYSPSASSLKVQNPNAENQKTLTINRYGVISLN